MKQPHFFIALSLPESMKELLFAQCEKVKDTIPFQRWVHKEDYHITMAFLGSVPEGKAKECMKILEDRVAQCSSFSLVLSGLGMFGDKSSPRILWYKTDYEEKLMKLQSIVKQVCLDTGFILDEKPFKPHITLARKFSGVTPLSEDLWREADHLVNKTSYFTTNQITLFRTHLDRTPKYESVYTIKLQH
ncbi:RNA 2',3'-cyclic phosphodiesterase [Peribacillus alkalitolerans]|uniref:RNA 2',3'-cyclic phosphodiesterase n=1 Tax=Peribacillus alkalitolerans TaxID=1550385 RepID=UPI0013D47AEC|nr:RNA 2',3'-cyclic phosphodiesterase [Peribacillus alkalitolerans]